MIELNNWYLLSYKPNSFNKAALNLERQGIHVFCPKQIQTLRKGTKFITKTIPLFPGYLFIKLNNKLVSWNSINSTYGVSKIISFGKYPCKVPKLIIQNLKKNCDQDNIVLQTPKLDFGDKIKIDKGPFTNFIGKILKVESNKRIWVLLEYMNKKSKIQFSSNYVSKLN